MLVSIMTQPAVVAPANKNLSPAETDFLARSMDVVNLYLARMENPRVIAKSTASQAAYAVTMLIAARRTLKEQAGTPAEQEAVDGIGRSLAEFIKNVGRREDGKRQRPVHHDIEAPPAPGE